MFYRIIASLSGSYAPIIFSHEHQPKRSLMAPANMGDITDEEETSIRDNFEKNKAMLTTVQDEIAESKQALDEISDTRKKLRLPTLALIAVSVTLPPLYSLAEIYYTFAMVHVLQSMSDSDKDNAKLKKQYDILTNNNKISKHYLTFLAFINFLLHLVRALIAITYVLPTLVACLLTGIGSLILMGYTEFIDYIYKAPFYKHNTLTAWLASAMVVIATIITFAVCLILMPIATSKKVATFASMQVDSPYSTLMYGFTLAIMAVAVCAILYGLTISGVLPAIMTVLLGWKVLGFLATVISIIPALIPGFLGALTAAACVFVNILQSLSQALLGNDMLSTDMHQVIGVHQLHSSGKNQEERELRAVKLLAVSAGDANSHPDLTEEAAQIVESESFKSKHS